MYKNCEPQVTCNHLKTLSDHFDIETKCDLNKMRALYGSFSDIHLKLVQKV